MDLSIIVPVYNVEKYIRTCLESVYSQGLDESIFEVIIVNDGSTDNSMGVIEDIISSHKNITIINQENQGLSVARNNGIASAKGEYILMPDSDDLLIKYSIKPLLEKAIETKVDLVIAGFVEMSNDEIKIHRNAPQKKQEEETLIIEKTGEQVFMEDINPHQPYIWRVFFRKDFITLHNLVFIPGIYVQDRPFFYESILKSKRCLVVSWPIYIYRKHMEGVSFCMKGKYALDYCFTISNMWQLHNSEELSPESKKKMLDYIYIAVKTLAHRLVYELQDKNKSIETIDYLRSICPDLKFQHGLKQRTISFLLRNLPHTYIKLRFIYANYLELQLFPYIKKLFHGSIFNA